MRAAKKMVLILGPRNQEIFERGRPTGRIPRNDDEAKRFWLQQWGSRLWTLPELLLAPPGKSIDIYYLPSAPNKEESIDITNFREQTRVEVPYDNRGKRIFGVGKDSWTKAAFSSRAYETKQDATDIASLVDHFEGTLVLPTLELITHAAQALWRRKKSTFKLLNGDCSYALMGLLRRRPPVKASDEDFEAFARLSLANDSDRLLERLICLLPHRRSAPWHEWKVAWKKVNLWDIEPIIQVAAIADNSTVVLDGAFGATIHWRKLHPVAFSKRKTAWREAVKWGIRLGAVYFLTAVILVAESPKPGNTTIKNPYGPTVVIPSPKSPSLIIGIIFLILTILVLVYAPWAMLKIYRGKFWSTQGWFFGIEGCADIGQVEKCLFAGNHHRLKWSTNGSILSRHHLGRLHNENGRECLPEEPLAASWTRGQFKAARKGRGGIERLYTLIDTYSMEATLFWAEVPPTAVFICGSEGGMKRAMLCSFDWKTNSFVRETVVRMKTMVVDKMSRVERFRFALSRKDTFQVEETH
jgi:hypothetical protein